MRHGAKIAHNLVASTEKEEIGQTSSTNWAAQWRMKRPALRETDPEWAHAGHLRGFSEGGGDVMACQENVGTSHRRGTSWNSYGVGRDVLQGGRYSAVESFLSYGVIAWLVRGSGRDCPAVRIP